MGWRPPTTSRKNHGVRNVAVLEKGWIGGGNTGRNTTVIRSNYFHPESAAVYDLALRLYEKLSDDLNFNIMLSQRGLLFFAHSRQEMELFARSVNAMQLNGIDAELLDAQDVRKLVPILNFSDGARFPVHGAFYQGRGGIARHDAVAWGYARGADALGVDIIQNCEVAGFRLSGGRITAIETNKGVIEAGAVGLAVAGHSGVMAAKAGFRLPVTSYALQAMVSEPVKPILHTVVDLAGDRHLCQPVRQGRAGVRRRARSLSLLRPARQSACGRDRGLGPHGDVPDLPRAEDAAEMGRPRGCRA